ncbi:DUF6297 family protein [Micromonospora matsumotoense]|uniref:ABC transporter ATP-binding protein n=1 Tax=Micromonospora matsumotoense TaxID=121616 RepID=UPI003D90403F
MGSTLAVRGLTRRFGALVVLDDVRFQLDAGQVAVVVGPNGSGKTTLLRCVVGADRPDEGEVLLDGRRCDETDPRVRAAVAAALDDIDFFPDLSVVEHLELVAYAHGGTADPVVLVTPAAQTWLVSSPVDRRAWLLPRFGGLVGGVTVGAGLLAVAAAFAGGHDRPADLGWAALAGLTCGATATGWAVVAQSARSTPRWAELPPSVCPPPVPRSRC